MAVRGRWDALKLRGEWLPICQASIFGDNQDLSLPGESPGGSSSSVLPAY